MNNNTTSVLEEPIANYITQHDDEVLSSQELGDILKNDIENAPSDSKTFAIHNFGILYAPHLNNCSEVARLAGAESFSASISDAKKIGLNLRNKVGKYVHNDSGANTPSSIRTFKEVLNSYLTAIRTKPFLLLAGISGTGKSRIVRKLAQATDNIDKFATEEERWNCHKPANFELIQVKPNWHNSMDVVGYKSNIGGAHYEFTPFVEFVYRAWLHQETPFFLCLDEMNLAPVEEYFAEYLSAIESRSFDEKGNYQTDPIIKPFDSFGMTVCGNMIAHLEEIEPMPIEIENYLRGKGLTLPKNLIVMGTVNMDETTFSFSRKVLDRAMSIEMNEVHLQNCISENEDEQVPILVSYNDRLVNRAIKSLAVVEGNPEAAKEHIKLTDDEANRIVEYLETINKILEGTPYKLGYRACNEALLYARANKELNTSDFMSTAIDEFTLMKILSRIEGDDSKLKTTKKVVKSAEGKLSIANEDKEDSNILLCLENVIKEYVNIYNSKSITKLHDMQVILGREHFVSFWG